MHDAAILGIPVDTGRLYDGADPGYELWLESVIDRVYATKERLRREEESSQAGMKFRK